MEAFYSVQTEDQMGKISPSLSVQPNLLEDIAQGMMHQVSGMLKVLTASCAKPLTAPVLLQGLRDQSLKRKAKPVPLSEPLSISLPILLLHFLGRCMISGGLSCPDLI